MEFIKKIFRERISSILLVIGLFISCFVLVNIVDFANKINIEKQSKNKYDYNLTFCVQMDSSYADEERIQKIEFLKNQLLNIKLGNVICEAYMWVNNTSFIVNTSIVVLNNEALYIECKEKYDVTKTNGILIGEDLVEYTFEKNGKSVLILDGIEWNVEGVLKNNLIGGVDERVYIFKKNCDAEKEAYITSLIDINVVCQFVSNHNIYEEFKMFSDNIGKEGLFIESTNIEENYYSEIYKVFKSVFIAVGIVFSIFNCFSVSYLWITARKKEIAIRKAYGYDTFKIILLLFKEILIISIISVLLCVIFQMIYSLVIDVDFVHNFVLKFLGVAVGMLFVICLIILKLVDDVRKVTPVNVINGGVE